MAGMVAGEDANLRSAQPWQEAQRPRRRVAREPTDRAHQAAEKGSEHA
jgi:hypothetical protein